MVKCTNCNSEITDLKCNHCGIDLKDYFFKLADEAQVNRRYKEAMKYMLFLQENIEDEEELSEIEKKIARLEFAMTDLTGKELDKKRVNIEKIIKSLALISLILLFFALGIRTYLNNDHITPLKTTVLLNIIEDNPKNRDANINKIEKILSYIENTNFKYNLNINGILLDYISKERKDIIERINKLIEINKIEIVASSYSGAILNALNDETINLQIKKDIELKEKLFKNKPKVFYLNGGIWDNKLTNNLKENGIKLIILEDKIIKNSSNKYNEYIVREFNDLFILNDDKDFIVKLEEYLFYKKDDVFFEISNYINKIAKMNNDKNFVLNYSSKFILDETNEADIEKMLQNLENINTIIPLNYSEIYNRKDLITEKLDNIENGTSIFTDVLVERLGNYNNWFEYRDNSNDFKKISKYFELQYNNLLKTKNIDEKFYNIYLEYFLKAQFKYGFPNNFSTEYIKNLNDIYILSSLLLGNNNKVKKDNKEYIFKDKTLYILENNKIIFYYNLETKNLIDNLGNRDAINIALN
ncbi:MAG: hypothetical protein PWP46_1179 [Fusobacteriaceae bacterium]|jgi:hypothetical protein|nr:hypothetical protein [Fusobacteriales bacterium]MDN5304296.1 hypothetical protein [Fusobacteriaceae bacterium]